MHKDNLICLFLLIFKIFLYVIIIYLAVLRLSCGPGDLGSLILHVWSLVVAWGNFSSCGMQTLSYGVWDLVPWPGIEPGPPALALLSLLATGPPGKSQDSLFFKKKVSLQSHLNALISHFVQSHLVWFTVNLRILFCPVHCCFNEIWPIGSIFERHYSYVWFAYFPLELSLFCFPKLYFRKTHVSGAMSLTW